MKTSLCKTCGVPLTDEEVYYYENWCDKCEWAMLKHAEAWRKGEIDDPELDRIFGIPKEDANVH